MCRGHVSCDARARVPAIHQALTLLSTWFAITLARKNRCFAREQFEGVWDPEKAHECGVEEELQALRPFDFQPCASDEHGVAVLRCQCSWAPHLIDSSVANPGKRS